MKRPRISIIAAIGKNRELGKDNKLLWHISEDLKRFKKLTTGHPIIMGRKTFDSIGRVLPNRVNIVVTRDDSFKQDDVLACNSIKEALEKAESVENDEIFIIGGGQIFEQIIKFADRLYLTVVEGGYEADAFFPDYSKFKTIVSSQNGESEGLRYKYVVLER
ncbi:MAG: dihydrofolate reductase [Candidatus Woykebacteria bacterium]